MTNDEFSPTHEPAWNPSPRVRAAEGWEMWLRAPGRLLSLPLVAVGGAMRPTLLIVQETNLIPRVMYLLRFREKGLVIGPASLGDRTGLGATIGFSVPATRDYVHGEVSGSTRQYSSTGIGVAAGPMRLDYGYAWRPEERFFGFGLQSALEDTSTFAAQSERVNLLLTVPSHGTNRPPAHARLSGWIGPRSLVVRTGREEDSPSFEQQFPGLSADQLDRRVEHLVYGAKAELDRRAGKPHWTHGHRIAFQAERFDRPIEALALHSARADGAEFTRLRLDAETGVSFMRDPRTLRLSFSAVDQRLSAGSRPLALPDLATLGGSAGLAGYDPGRFHDLDAMVMKLTYLFPLLQYLEFDLHAETGGVYHDIRHDPRLDGLKSSFGFAFRPRLDTAPLGSIGMDWSSERVRFRYSFGGVE